MNPAPLLQAENLGHRFDRSWLFRRVHLDLQPGDRLLLTGPNGSGKSTLLRALAGLLRPREGHTTTTAPVGYSAIDLALYPQLTAAEHLALAARLRSTRQTTVQPRTQELLALVNLQDATDKPARAFSTGMRARLKLALALQHQPDVLLLDEPTAALDESGRALVHHIATTFPGAIVVATNDPADHPLATHHLHLA